MKGVLPIKGASAASGREKKAPKELENVLNQYFGYSGFRGKQLEAIEAVLSGRDCFCLMPTGGGKSMCYQIPALVRTGIVLVISPLIALMENQVASLKNKGIPAEFLSSTQTSHTKQTIHEDLDSGKPSLKLLYVTPELVATPGFMAKLKKLYHRGLLSLVAIDEAHCISTWGHDFRPSYRKLSSLRKQFADIPLLALTATAVPKVQKDVISSLCLQNPLILRASFNRPNIFYEAYHAGLNSKVRSSVLDDWLSSRTQVVVATVAFGMESGRAGRDQQPSRSVLYYGLDDRRRMEFILRNTKTKKSQSSSSSNELSEKALADFSQIVEYCESSSCRRKKIIESFGEKVQPTLCQRSCDACKHPNLVSSHLEELRRVPNCRFNKVSPVFQSSLVNPAHLDTEFWNREDEASISAEDISDSDDGNEVVSNIAISKIPSNAALDAKFKALERAENAYYQGKGQTNQQGGGLVDKKSISQALRDACWKRLLDALGQAKLRLGNLPCDEAASATHLETECFKKYEKVGKTFYNSQIAATVRWLSSATSNQMHDRFHTLIDQATDHSVSSSPDIVPESSPAPTEVVCARPGETIVHELEKTKHSDESAKTIAASAGNVELPTIPSFRECLSQKGKDCKKSSSDSNAGSQPFGFRRKSTGLVEKQETSKKMKS
ncbi:ATP-dependent DNA helicase Q-like 3 isoform X4 [Panicum virgatum]|uniref:ATP-dependent DNA helicase Q-like 3 isoform X4 n=1 Tax=Panicum virgatum TaxID=38727 RepID=UPI0019D5E199|nr:ATP-dependent DNA helicase Q-like 3 isoform X4 [Panicum virgatum]